MANTISLRNRDLDFDYENSLVKILVNRSCPEIKLAGLTVGGFEEGNEYEVLAGAKKVFEENKNLNLAIASYHYPEETKKIYQFLKSKGLKVSIANNYIGYLCGICQHYNIVYGMTL